ncbi:TetR/AcrR family transcriptional regulator [Streptomyces diacarni]|uniref:TetR/AcrR family transcriptional regulator n=1 Tax=Streptomyces diacarni TaxID=2800381 RepID=A0A367EP76_9ACTN|nr:TetR/AcrR family transcriptional regulator [Streptomyces diacarni]RCG19549.1 TetR/AcrR family transcriptional regulator [Streptomyces diacarni]
MPAARETLLEAAHAAVRTRPWSVVRMVDVAAAADVSRQTLYNEFGSKEGLGAALVSRLVENFLDGTGRAVTEACRGGADPAACCAAAAHWVLRTARAEPIVHAALTGCWGPRIPLPPGPPPPAGWDRAVREAHPAEPGRLAHVLCDRAVAGLDRATRLPVGGPRARPRGGPAAPAETARGDLLRAYEAGLRVALSYVVAPQPGPDDDPCGRVDAVVRALLAC